MNRSIRDITRKAMQETPGETGQINPQLGQQETMGSYPTQQAGDPAFGSMGMMDPMDAGQQGMPEPQMPQQQESPWRDRSIEIPEIVVQPPGRRPDSVETPLHLPMRRKR